MILCQSIFCDTNQVLLTRILMNNYHNVGTPYLIHVIGRVWKNLKRHCEMILIEDKFPNYALAQLKLNLRDSDLSTTQIKN